LLDVSTKLNVMLSDIFSMIRQVIFKYLKHEYI
jgi:hypothetical protein